METEKQICPCNRCKSAKSFKKATVKKHVKLNIEFSYDMRVTVGEFIDTSIEMKLDDKFWTVARYTVVLL